ncbi:MAG: dTDP-4-dehydrorhamnose reductase [Candidatus Micrarchaeota archaeon]|nr:dTDP-4-dehydrorhamnose reductase [Candidatus Micrarchaeota archaeon]
MTRILVIGATGLLGSRLMELGKESYEMHGTYSRDKPKGSNMHRMDVTKRDEVFSILEKVKPDCVADTAAITDVDYCETHPEEAWLVNVDGTKNVAEACKRIGAKMVFLSTDYVFDGKKLDYSEKDKPRPMNYYAKTKLVSEHVLEALGVNYITARTAVLYGLGGLGKKNFVTWIIEKLDNKEKIRIVTDQHNNPTYSDNLAEILLALYRKDAKGLFHVTGSDCLSRYEFALRISDAFGLDGKLISPTTTPELNQIAVRPEKVSMVTNKVERVTGIKPMGVDEGLRRLKEQLEVKE